ncbi:MAG: porin [Candidatus Protistobacter heckmanni]|nr:porin [Candidatus Protistobacter heckmanni]
MLRMQSGNLSGSRFGPRGSEDLGGGTKAIFTLESGFNLGSGASEQGGRLFGRQAFVGVDSRSGALTLGRQYNLLFDNMLELDPMSAAQYSAVVHDQAFVGRADKSIKYSGNFSGVKVARCTASAATRWIRAWPARTRATAAAALNGVCPSAISPAR